MNRFPRIALISAFGGFLLSAAVLAQTPKSAQSLQLMPLEEVKAGMKGTASSVFAGSASEEFGVEILGVLPGYPNPRQSAIIAKLSGKNVDRTGVFAGMSGSPVYIDGKLVGAIAFSFPFAKEPIAGITPIKQMIDIFERGSEGNGKSEPRSQSFTQLSSTELKSSLPKQTVTSGPMIASVSGGSLLQPFLGQQIAPIATPLVFSGISQNSLNLFGADLVSQGLMPVSAAGGGAAITSMAPITETTLSAGSSVSVQLIRGDYSVAASGTVTMRDGDRIYAFGHPFLSLGEAEMPMTESSVVTVIPNANNSFKLAVPGRLVGSISQDRSTGIFGKLGQTPKMIPVKINLHTSRERSETFNYEVVNDRFLTPILLNLSIYNSITASERSLGDATITISGKIDVDGQSPIDIERRFSAANAAQMASGSVAVPVAALLSSGFKDVGIGGVTLDISSSDAKNTATLERIALDRTEVHRGQSFEIQAFVRTESGKQFVERIPVKLPDDVPIGQVLVFVGDGAALQQGSAAQAFVPQDLGDLVSTINKIKKNDRLYIKLFRITSGAVIGTNELPNLPPSMVATLNNERSSGGFTPTVLSPVLERELAPADFVVNGQQIIAIDVIR
jgi:hypothetical protein